MREVDNGIYLTGDMDLTLTRLVDDEIVAAREDGRPVDLHGLPLYRLPAGHLSYMDLTGGNFEGCIMPTDCSGMVLKDANLGNCHISGRFDHVVADGANFEGARIVDADMSGTSADGAYFANSHWQSVTLDDTSSFAGAEFRDTIAIDCKGMSDEVSDRFLSYEQGSGCDLGRVDAMLEGRQVLSDMKSVKHLDEYRDTLTARAGRVGPKTYDTALSSEVVKTALDLDGSGRKALEDLRQMPPYNSVLGDEPIPWIPKSYSSGADGVGEALGPEVFENSLDGLVEDTPTARAGRVGPKTYDTAFSSEVSKTAVDFDGAREVLDHLRQMPPYNSVLGDEPTPWVPMAYPSMSDIVGEAPDSTVSVSDGPLYGLIKESFDTLSRNLAKARETGLGGANHGADDAPKPPSTDGIRVSDGPDDDRGDGYFDPRG